MQKLLNGIGLGTFPFAGPFGKIETTTSASVLHAFLETNSRYIDVAPTYAFGQVESFLGEELKRYPRDAFFINTSCGYVLQNDKFVVSGKYDDVIADCEASLKRLKLDYIDLYISHIPDANTPFEETISAMKALKKAGKIKCIGVSNVTLEQLQGYNFDGSVEFVQNRFSLLNQNISSDFREYLLNNNIGLVAYQVIDRGLLTNKVLSSFPLAEGDLRTKKPEFAAHIVQEISNWVSTSLYPIAQKHGISIATLAIKWARNQDFVAMCQCGATNPKYIPDFADVINISVPDDFYREIDLAYNSFTKYLREKFDQNIRGFMGLESYNLYSGSASGK
jgi:aryl-alcohol dehydrogenase-like predicted oxidoreductase